MGAATPWPAGPRGAAEGEVLSAAFAAVHQPLAVVEGDQIVQANRAFVKAVGTSREKRLCDLPPKIVEQMSRTGVRFEVLGRQLTVASLQIPGSARPGAANAIALETTGRLVSGVAHDFNNLLTGILLYCDLLIVGLKDNPRLLGQVREMRAAGEQGGALIQQLLTMARHQVEQPRPISWNETIVGMRPLLKRLIGENIELISELEPALEPVEMDPAQMQQAILNLVLNARDAMPDGGKVTMATRNCPPCVATRLVEFSVRDTGCGMDDNTRARAFEPFFSTKAAGRGNGLGLATVHNIVSQRGGTVKVESVPGKGTEVTLRLPRLGAKRVHQIARKKR